MIYDRMLPARFVARPNRFVAQVLLQGQPTLCHVKNTGRCRELLLPGTQVFVQQAANPQRKTGYDLISVYKAGMLVNMDSAAPNPVFAAWAQQTGFFGPKAVLRPEQRWGNSRFDFLVHTPGGPCWYVETKGVTLEQDGLALFPDAPTLRGVKHLQELARAVQAGYRAMVVFIIQMKGPHALAPNDATHPAFGAALRAAQAAGVQVLALDCRVTENSITADAELPVLL